jgi:hypothetical protein
MCFSQFAQYAPRPVKEYTPVQRPAGAPPTNAELDPNLYGPVPTPPEWQEASASANGHSHATNVAETPAATVYAATSSAEANGTSAISAVKTQTVEAVVVELANGTRLLICPL